MTVTRPPFFSAAVLSIVICSVFWYTVKAREPWFGALSLGHHQYLTGCTLLFTKNWLREGAWNLRFAMFSNPRSVEFPTLDSRQPYVSHPTGSLVPIYAMSRVLGREPTPGLVMGYNLAQHLGTSLLLGWMTWLLLTRLGYRPWIATGWALLPALGQLLLPGPMYWHQCVYFTDQAVSVPFLVLVFLEVIRAGGPAGRAGRTVDLLIAATMVWGTATDLFFILVVGVLYGKRLLTGELGATVRTVLGRSILLWLPSATVVGLFLGQLLSLGMLGRLRDRFFVRVGAVGNTPGKEYVERFTHFFWGEYMELQYGAPGTPLVAIAVVGLATTLAYQVWRRKSPRRLPPPVVNVVSAACLVTLPCLLQIYVFKNAAAIHDFYALRMTFIIGFVTFVALPVAGYEILVHENRIRRSGAVGPAALLLAAGCLGYIVWEHRRYPDMFPPVERDWPVIAGFFKANITERDIVVSPDFVVPEEPPQLLSLTMKRVYPVQSPNELRRMGLHRLKADHRVAVVFLNPPDETWRAFLADKPMLTDGRMLVYRFESGRLK